MNVASEERQRDIFVIAQLIETAFARIYPAAFPGGDRRRAARIMETAYDIQTPLARDEGA